MPDADSDGRYPMTGIQDSIVGRRQFVAAVSAGAASFAIASTARAMQVTQNFAGPMQQDAYLPVRLAPKPGAQPSMTDQARDDLEHRIKCQCGCVLDVFTCRTTDFSCAVSPAMHADVKALITGGYNGAEIMSAFQAVYGERVLMAPTKEGFNLLGYIMPFAVLIGGGAVVAGLIRKWGARARLQPSPAASAPVEATSEELEALEAAVRDDT